MAKRTVEVKGRKGITNYKLQITNWGRMVSVGLFIYVHLYLHVYFYGPILIPHPHSLRHPEHREGSCSSFPPS